VNRELTLGGVIIFYVSFGFKGYFSNIIRRIEKYHSEGWLFSMYQSVLGLFFKCNKVNRELSFGEVVII